MINKGLACICLGFGIVWLILGFMEHNIGLLICSLVHMIGAYAMFWKLNKDEKG
jgi:hypothetical protein